MILNINTTGRPPGRPSFHSLSVRIHRLVVLLILARGHSGHPVLVVEVPVDGLDDADFEGRLGIPAEVGLDLRRVDAVAAVVAETVLDVLYEPLVDLRVVQTLRKLRDDGLHDKDVRPLVVTADVVDLADAPRGRHHVDSLAVVLNKEPVAYLHAVAVDRQLPVVLGVVDHQRYQLLGELPHTVVVGTPRDVDRHAVGIVERLHEVVR